MPLVTHTSPGPRTWHAGASLAKAGSLDPLWLAGQRFASRFADEFTLGFEELQRRIEREFTNADIERAMRAHKPEILTDKLPRNLWWAHEGTETLGIFKAEPVSKRLERALAMMLADAFNAEAKRLNMPVRFDIDNPFSIPWIRQHVGALVTMISQQTMAGIRDAVEGAFDAGDPPRELAKRLRRMVGLRPDQVSAVFNFQQKLIAEGRSASQVERATRNFVKQKLNERGLLIARTETIDAMNAGRHQSWMVGQRRGHLPPNINREWVAEPASIRTCKLCVSLNGQVVGMEEPFHSATLGLIMNPTAHPACRCVTRLSDRPRTNRD